MRTFGATRRVGRCPAYRPGVCAWLRAAPLVLMLALAACGVKNDPIPPSEVEAEEEVQG